MPRKSQKDLGVTRFKPTKPGLRQDDVSPPQGPPPPPPPPPAPRDPDE